MAFRVFMHRSDSIYDDRLTEQYQFPRQYLGRVQACVGDWIVYLAPRSAGESRGYFAIARVQEVIPDPKAPNMYLAIIEPGSYLDFANLVPFRDEVGPVERGLVNANGRLRGSAQSAVREISSADFDRIVARGLSDSDVILPRVGDPAPVPGLAETQAPFEFEQVRERVEQLTSRAVRDRAFRKNVLRAYGERCAMTGLKLINGLGRAEVDAAHIRPVQANGPDVITNGIALSGTIHWMFDCGLIGLDDDLTIRVSRHVNDQDSVRAMINKSGQANLPFLAKQRPHPRFLQWHRENCFKS